MKNTKRYLLFLLLVVVGISSCKVKQKLVDKPDVIVIDEETNNKETTGEKENEKENITIVKPDTTIIVSPSLELKETYNIAIILPLLSDSIFSSYSNSVEDDLEDFKIPYRAQQALHFLEGAMLAFENLNLQSRFHIKVYDNQYSYTQTDFILKQLATQDIDLIVGPMKKQNVQLVSNYAKRNDIMMLSPFTPSKSAGSNYYKYIMAEPSLDLHLKLWQTTLPTV